MYIYYILYKYNRLYYNLYLSYIKKHLLKVTFLWKPELRTVRCLFRRKALQMLQV